MKGGAESDYLRRLAFVVGCSLCAIVSAGGTQSFNLNLDGTDWVALDDTTISHLYVTSRSSVSIPGGMTVSVMNYGGGGLLTKKGKGTLSIGALTTPGASIQVREGKIHFRKTGYQAAEPITPEPAFHVDASDPSGMEIVGENGDNWIRRWSDVRGKGYPYAGGNKSDHPLPFLRENALNGLPIVDFGGFKFCYNDIDAMYGHGGYLNWDRALNNIREVFLVFSDTEDVRTSKPAANSCPFVLAHTETYDFHRGYDDFSLFCGHASPNVRDGSIRLNGEEVPCSTPLPEGFQLIHLRTTADASANAFANNRGITTGGQRLAEVIVHTNLIDEAKSRELEKYLMHKWGLNKTVRSLTLADQTEIEVDEGLALTIRSYKGSGEVLKKGLGKLALPPSGQGCGSIRVHGGGISFNGGRFDHLAISGAEVLEFKGKESKVYSLSGGETFVKKGDAPLEVFTLNSSNLVVEGGSLAVQIGRQAGVRPWLHVDASRAETFAFDGAPGDSDFRLISRWDDLRKNGICARSEDKKPYLRPSFLNGRPIVDFGGLNFHKDTGAMEGYGGYLLWNQRCENIREVALVFSDTDDAANKPDGCPGSFLLSDTAASNGYFLHRGYSTPAQIMGQWAHPGWKGGMIHMDGQPVTWEAPVQAGFHVFYLKPPDASVGTAGCFANDRNIVKGGQRLAEVLIFTDPTTEAQQNETENYLRNKWMGRGLPGPVYDRVEIHRDASLSLPPGTTINSLTGPGIVQAEGGICVGQMKRMKEIRASLTIQGESFISVDSFSPVQVGGKLTMPAEGVFSIDAPVPLERFHESELCLIQAEEIAPQSLEGWKVTGTLARPGRCARLVIDGNRVLARLSPLGTDVLLNEREDD